MGTYNASDNLGNSYEFTIAGEEPTEAELSRMQAFVNDQARAQQEESRKQREAMDRIEVPPAEMPPLIPKGISELPERIARTTGSVGTGLLGGLVDAAGGIASELFPTLRDQGANRPTETTDDIVAGRYSPAFDRIIPAGGGAFEISESGDVVDPQGRRVVAPGAFASASLREKQQELAKGTTTLDEALSGDVGSLISFGIEQGFGNAPNYAAAVLASPLLYVSIVGNTLAGRARNRAAAVAERGGTPEEIAAASEYTRGDILTAFGSAIPQVLLERTGAKALGALGGAKPGPGVAAGAARGLVVEGGTEGLQEGGQAIAEQVGTRDTGTFGVDFADVGKRAAGGAIAGAAFGGTVGGASALGSRRTDTETGPAEPESAAPSESPVTTPEPARVLEPGRDRRSVQVESESLATDPDAQAIDPSVDVEALGRAGVRATDPSESFQSTAPDMMDYLASRLEGTVAMKEESLGADMKAVAEQLGVDPARKKHSLGYAEALKQLKESSLQTTSEDGSVVFTERIDELIDGVNRGDVTPSTVDMLGMFSYYNNRMKKISELQSEAEAVLSSGGKDKEVRRGLKDIRARMKEAEGQAVSAAQAIRSGTSEAGRIMRYAQFEVDRDMNLSEALVKAAVRRGKPLTDKQRKRITDTWVESRKQEKEQSSVRKKLKDALDNKEREIKELEESGAPDSVLELERERRDDILTRMLKAESKIRSAQQRRDTGIGRALNVQALNYLGDLIATTTALKASYDISGPGRQGAILGVQDFPSFIKTLPVAFKLLADRRGRAKAAQIMDDMLASDMQPVRDLAELELTEAEGRSSGTGQGLQRREEVMMNRYSDIIGDSLAPSNNAYAVSLNLIRTNAFDKGARAMAELQGVENPTAQQIADTVPREDLVMLAEFINTSTGRGSWNPERALGIMRKLFFAPRFKLSRIKTVVDMVQIMTGTGRYGNMSKEGLKYMRQQVSKNVAVLVSMGLLSTLAGAGYEDDEDGSATYKRFIDFIDPASSRFLKLSIGNTATDLLGGIPSGVRNILPSMVKMYDDIENVGSSAYADYMRRSPRFLTYSLNPVARAAVSSAFGVDFAGRPLTPEEQDQLPLVKDSVAAQLLVYRILPQLLLMGVPINVETFGRGVIDTLQQPNLDEGTQAAAAAAANVIGDFIGLNITVYDDDDGRESRALRPIFNPYEDY